MKSFEWVNAGSLDDAMSSLTDGAVYKAGGVDLMDMMKEHLAEPTRLVNLNRIPGLDKITDDEKAGLKIGPLVTLHELSEHPIVKSRYTALAESAGHAATPQIRNMATAGGNLLQRPRCWYFRNELIHCRKKGGEICYAQEGENQYHAIFDNQLCAIVHPSSLGVALVALNASIKLKGAKGERTLALEQFFALPSVDLHKENLIQPGEIITEINVPAPVGKSDYIKQGEKESFDWPIAEVAASVELDGAAVKSASIILGAASPVPHRAKQSEAALIGKKLDSESIRAAAALSVEKAHPMSVNQYKLVIFPAVVERVLMKIAGLNA